MVAALPVPVDGDGAVFTPAVSLLKFHSVIADNAWPDAWLTIEAAPKAIRAKVERWVVFMRSKKRSEVTPNKEKARIARKSRKVTIPSREAM